MKLDIKRRGPKAVTKITIAAEAGLETDPQFLHELARAIERACLRPGGGPRKAVALLTRGLTDILDAD